MYSVGAVEVATLSLGQGWAAAGQHRREAEREISRLPLPGQF